MPDNVLVYRTGQLGDTLVSTPALLAIRAAYPQHNLIYLTDQPRHAQWFASWKIIEPMNLFSEVLFFSMAPGNLASSFNVVKLARQIRQRKPVALYYLRDFPWNNVRRDALFFRVLCGIPKCYGLDPELERMFGRRDQSGKLVRYPREVDRLLKLVSDSGAPVPVPENVKFGLPISHKDIEHIDALWREYDINSDVPVIGLGPGSKMPAKRWPLARFTAIAQRFLEFYPAAKILIFGGSEDVPDGEEVRRSLGNRVVNVAGKLSLLESAEGLRRCWLYVGNDTGTMHLAAAVKTPCVAIFSSRDHPGRWEPYGSNQISLRTDPPCAGCLLETCIEQQMRCLSEITVEMVWRAVQRVMERVDAVMHKGEF